MSLLAGTSKFFTDIRRTASMGDVSQVATSISAAIDQASRCATTETSDSYDELGAQVDTLERQAHQAVKSQLDIASLLPKLKESKPLGPSELKTLELLIVGDAEYFLKYEADLDRWKGEVSQLMAEVAKLRSLSAGCRWPHASASALPRTASRSAQHRLLPGPERANQQVPRGNQRLNRYRGIPRPSRNGDSNNLVRQDLSRVKHQ
jgi:hypothetical protein